MKINVAFRARVPFSSSGVYVGVKLTGPAVFNLDGEKNDAFFNSFRVFR